MEIARRRDEVTLKFQQFLLVGMNVEEADCPINFQCAQEEMADSVIQMNPV